MSKNEINIHKINKQSVKTYKLWHTHKIIYMKNCELKFKTIYFILEWC